MKNKSLFVSKWLYIVLGIVIGVALVTSFEWTRVSQAVPVGNQNSAEAGQASFAGSSGANVAQQLSDIFANVAEKVNPSVVTIFTETKVQIQQQPFSGSPFEEFFGDDFFRQFFQTPRPQGDLKRMGLGSGVIVDANGTILTNNHVVKDADNIKVQLMDGRTFEAKVKGTDPLTDLAVVTIKAKDLQAIKLGNSDEARVGEWVLAIGSPLNPQLEHTVTAGIISAKGRSGVGLTRYEDYIQTDAAINPGNSGGAMVNLEGELIGINSAIATQTGGFMGIGFAIPVNLAKKVMTDIIEKGKVVRGWLGVYIQDINSDLAKALKLNKAKGVIVSKVQKNSPAEKAGLKEEDIILRFNGKEVSNSTELSTWVSSTSPNTTVTLEVLRDGKLKQVKVKLGELNPKAQQLAKGENSYDNLGLTVSNITADVAQKYQLDVKSGVVVTSVDPRGLAAAVGIREGDVILKVNRKSIESVKDFDRIVSKVKPGDDILFYLHRKEGNFFVAFTVPER